MGWPGYWLKPSVFIPAPGREEADGHTALAKALSSPARPTHMWLTHAPSGERNGNPETQALRRRSTPRQPLKATPSLEFGFRLIICHMLAGPNMC